MQDFAPLNAFLYAQGLAQRGEKARWHVLTGGVSSEIWRVELPGRSVCVKRALSKLKVSEDWQAPTSRNAYEWQWLCFVASHLPQAAPRPLARDAAAGVFAMEFLAPERYPVWKEQLLSGRVDPATAEQVGVALATLHEMSAHKVELAQQFDSSQNFRALRIEPYLLATAARHPDLADYIGSLAERTLSTVIALVHGDVSPKNILVGPLGPVFLDAECAWYGDPAFDVAFCLNHLLLKTVARPDRASALMQSFDFLAEAYFNLVHFEPREALEARTAHLLPALTLARVDGKSPVEYLANDQQELVRRKACSLLRFPVDCLGVIAALWVQDRR